MCLAPTALDSGIMVGCRKCWQCRERKIDDWVGRCIAESKTAKACHAVTLTYGPDEDGNKDHPRAALLTYSDVQKYFKRLRKKPRKGDKTGRPKDGYPCRYFAVGEYGSTKGRSHWHLIVFWLGAVPPHQLTTDRDNPIRFAEQHWKAGFSQWHEVTPASIRYGCKYIQKDIGKAERQGSLSMSKLPPLGAVYFANLASRYAAAALAPQDLFYSFPLGESDRDGKPIRYRLGGKSAELYLQAYCDAWERQQPGIWMPNSELVNEYLDGLVPESMEIQFTKPPGRVEVPKASPHGATAFIIDHVSNTYVCMLDGVRYEWRRDNTGEWTWHENLKAKTARLAAEQKREAYRRASRGQ